MLESYKKSGEKIKLGNRNACIYTKGTRKTKYVKSNKEMVLLSRELKRLKITTPKKQVGGDDISLSYAGIIPDYKPVEYNENYENKESPKYYNKIKIVENPEKNPGRNIQSGLLDIYISMDSVEENSLLENNLKFSNKEQKINVVKWSIPVESKVLIIGDIHGDKIALERVFQRWIKKKYLISSQTGAGKLQLRVAENIYIISTGDLIDYGSNSITVLFAMLILRRDNPGKVMLLCGNHETDNQNISGRDKLNDEIEEKQKQISEKLIIKNIKLIGPDMLALHFGEELEGTYFMHGMYPVKYTVGTRQFTFWPKDLSINGPLLETLIQWNDLSTSGDTTATERDFGGQTNVCALGKDKLREIMNIYRIKGFIRGHQDFCGAQLYHNKDMTDCSQTTNITTTFINHNTDTDTYNYTRECKKTPSLFSSGWCKTDDIKYKWEKVDVDFEIARVITISMANEKTGSAPLGGYIELTVEKINP